MIASRQLPVLALRMVSFRGAHQSPVGVAVVVPHAVAAAVVAMILFLQIRVEVEALVLELFVLSQVVVQRSVLVMLAMQFRSSSSRILPPVKTKTRPPLLSFLVPPPPLRYCRLRLFHWDSVSIACAVLSFAA